MVWGVRNGERVAMEMDDSDGEGEVEVGGGRWESTLPQREELAGSAGAREQATDVLISPFCALFVVCTAITLALHNKLFTIAYFA